MTQEEKQLLLKDICARLPYGIVIHTDYKDIRLDRKHCGVGVLYYEDYSEEAKKECGYDETDFSILISGCFYGHNIKPYLRPLSSMTEEEENELDKTDRESSRIYFNDLHSRVEKYGRDNLRGFLPDYPTLDWLNAHHFDYRGLIEKGIALEAPENMYKKE